MNKEDIINSLNEDNLSVLPKRYLTEGLTPFNLCASFIMCSCFKDAFPMIIAREDVFRSLSPASESALKLLKNKVCELHPDTDNTEALDFVLYSDCYHITNMLHVSKYTEASVMLRYDIQNGKYQHEAKKILSITKSCMDKLFEECIPKISDIVHQHLKDLPTDALESWMREFNQLIDECIALHNLVNPDFQPALSKQEYNNDFSFPELPQIIQEVKNRDKEINSGVGILFELLSEKGKMIYPELSDAIDNLFESNDMEVSAKLLELVPLIQEDVKSNNITSYEPSRISEALVEHIEALLLCYKKLNNLVSKYVNTINRHKVYILNGRIFYSTIEAFRILDVFCPDRYNTQDKLLSSLLSCDFSSLNLDGLFDS